MGGTMVIIHEEQAVGSQDLRYLAVFDHAGARWLASIRRDFYIRQSFAKVERWDGTEWQMALMMDINALGMGEVKPSSTMRARKDLWIGAARDDAERMVGVAATCTGDDTSA